MRKDDFYNQLIDRNYLFINRNTQAKIKNTTLCFLGCGLGANIAIAAARIGITHFLLYDNDKVEIGNLNRQPYSFVDINKQKIKQLKKSLKLINPSLDVKIKNQLVTYNEIIKQQMNAQICINTIDWSKDYIQITDFFAFDKNIPVIVPMNIGFGSLILVFKRGALPFSSYIKNNDYSLEGIVRSIFKVSSISLPAYLSKNLSDIFAKIIKKKIEPQIMPAALLTNAFVTSIIVKLIKNDKIKLAPDAIYFDLFEGII